jgi:cytochrome c-type biogenesis protein CcmH
MLWVILAILTASVLAAVLAPLCRGRRQTMQRGDRVAVYRAQLAVVPDEVDRGLLNVGQGAAARLEIERRLLAAARDDEAAEGRRPVSAAPLRPLAAVSLGAALFVATFAIYLVLGSPDLGGGRFVTAAQTVDAGARPQPPELVAGVASLAKTLDAGGGSLDDWRRLARMQAELGRWQDSGASYRRLTATFGGSSEDSASTGEMLVLAANGVVKPDARTAFNDALERDVSNMSARYYLGLADAQAGKPAAAIERWRRLEAEAPSEAPWLPTLRRQIAATATFAGIASPTTPPSPAAVSAAAQLASIAAPPAKAVGPGAADIEAARALPPEQRATMISGMVKRLADRLQAEPDDVDGWQRLARAYGVLGDTEKAVAAAARAAALQPGQRTHP